MATEPEMMWQLVPNAHTLLKNRTPERVMIYTTGAWDGPVTDVRITFRGGLEVNFRSVPTAPLRVETRAGEEELAHRKHHEMVQELCELRARVRELEGDGEGADDAGTGNHRPGHPTARNPQESRPTP